MRHPSIVERVEQFKLYYARKNERPLFGFFLGSEYPMERYPASAELPSGRPLCPSDFRVDRYVEDCVRLFEAHEACGGDFIYSACAYWGTPWLEAALGCPIFADHSTGSISTRPPEGFGGAASIPNFDPASPWMAKAREFLVRLGEKSRGRFPLATTRMRGISDLLSALFGGEGFLFELMSDPGALDPLCENLTDFWIEFGKMQLEHIPLFHGGVGSFYYYMWAPEGTVWHQEDAAALLSPSLYDEAIRPWDEQIVGAFPHCIMHTHPSGFVPYDAYLRMGMTAIEVHIDEGGPRAEALAGIYRKILEVCPLLIWGDIPEGDLDFIFSELAPQGLAVQTVVQSAEHAQNLLKRYSPKE
ncbi:hypothetical protein HQ520_08320 [bacterium]|nr:hypothetical protein [bacterium]